jgi:hypothetical protein
MLIDLEGSLIFKLVAGVDFLYFGVVPALIDVVDRYNTVRRLLWFYFIPISVYSLIAQVEPVGLSHSVLRHK